MGRSAWKAGERVGGLVCGGWCGWVSMGGRGWLVLGLAAVGVGGVRWRLGVFVDSQ